MSLKAADLETVHMDDYLTPNRLKVLSNFSSTLIGSSGSGKTTTVKYLIKAINADETNIFAAHLDDWNNGQLDEFKQKVSVSTLRNGKTDQEPDEPDEDWFKKWNKKYKESTSLDIFLARTIHYRQTRPQISAADMPSRFLILDDLTSDLKKIFEQLCELLDNLRHYNIHILVISHAPLSVPPQLRSRFRFHINLKVELAEPCQLRALRGYFLNKLDAKEMRAANASLFDDTKALVCKMSFNVERDQQSLARELGELKWLRTPQVLYILKDDILNMKRRKIPRRLAPESVGMPVMDRDPTSDKRLREAFLAALADINGRGNFY